MDKTELIKIIGIVGGVLSSLLTLYGMHRRAIRRKDAELKKSKQKLIQASEELTKALGDGKKAEQRNADLKRIAEQRFAELKEKHRRELAERQLGHNAGALEQQGEIARLIAALEEMTSDRDQQRHKLDEKKAELAGYKRHLRELLKQQGKIWTANVPKDAPPFRPLRERKTVIIAVLNLKGGVGKTTITANLAGMLGSQGRRVLMIDLDHQRSLSRMLLTDVERTKLVQQKKSVQTFFAIDGNSRTPLLGNMIKVDGMPGCELIANHDPVVGAEDELGLEELEMQMQLSWLLNPEKTGDIRFILREGLHSDSVLNTFDFVFLDCPPRLSTACINAVAAADFVIIPVQGEEVAKRSLEHLALRLKELRAEGPCPSLRVLGVLGNLLYQAADLETAPEVVRLRASVAELSKQGQWPEPVEMFATVLPRMRQYLDASNELGLGKKLRLAISFPAVRTQFEQLAKEIENRINDHRNSG